MHRYGLAQHYKRADCHFNFIWLVITASSAFPVPFLLRPASVLNGTFARLVFPFAGGVLCRPRINIFNGNEHSAALFSTTWDYKPDLSKYVVCVPCRDI